MAIYPSSGGYSVDSNADATGKHSIMLAGKHIANVEDIRMGKYPQGASDKMKTYLDQAASKLQNSDQGVQPTAVASPKPVVTPAVAAALQTKNTKNATPAQTTTPVVAPAKTDAPAIPPTDNSASNTAPSTSGPQSYADIVAAHPNANTGGSYQDTMKQYMNKVIDYAGMRFPITPTKTPNIPGGPNAGGITVVSRLMDLATNFLAGYDKAIQMKQSAAQFGLENMGRMATYNMMRPGQVANVESREANRNFGATLDADLAKLETANSALQGATIASKLLKTASVNNPVSTAPYDRALLGAIYSYTKSADPADQAMSIGVLGNTANIPLAKKLKSFDESYSKGKDVQFQPDERLSAVNVLNDLAARHYQRVEADLNGTADRVTAEQAQGIPVTLDAIIPKDKANNFFTLKKEYDDFNAPAPVSGQ